MFKRMANDDYTTLIESLRFKNPFESAAPLISAHLGTVESLFQKCLSQDPFITRPVLEALGKLPQENIARLITSPYFCELLMIAKTDLEAVRLQILQALVAEIRLVDPGFEHPLKPIWTIDADRVLDPAVAEKFPALQTARGIRLNYQSYVHNTGKAGIGGYTLAAAQDHLERLETGLGLIEKASSSADSLVHLFTTTIQVRQNLNRPNTVNSSTHTSIGLIRCDNFHNLHTDMPEIVDMLVHESIHQYLHLFEEQLFPFVYEAPKDLLDQRKFASPWSGNLIDLRSYTHAILVWFGLWHFWGDFKAAHLTHPEVSEKLALQKQAEAAFGFVNSASVLDNLGEARSFLSADYVKQVDRIQNELQHLTQAV